MFGLYYGSIVLGWPVVSCIFCWRSSSSKRGALLFVRWMVHKSDLMAVRVTMATMVSIGHRRDATTAATIFHNDENDNENSVW